MIRFQKETPANRISPFQALISGGIILAVIFLTYRNMLDNFFTGDDFPWVYHIVKMRYFFGDGLAERYTWMGSTLSFYVDLLISGTNPWGYNATNLFIHLVNSTLVGFLGYFLTRDIWPGLLTMGLWGINAQGVEAVLWKTGRGHSLALLCILGALVSFIAWDQKKTYWFYILALLSAICAHLTLFNAVMLPAILCSYLLIFKGFPKKVRQLMTYIKVLLPFMAITGGYLYLYLFVFTTLAPSEYYNRGQSLIIKSGRYLLDYFFIFPQNFRNILHNEKFLPYLGIVTLTLFITAFIRIKNKPIRFAAIWMMCTLLPYLSVIGSADYQPSRYRYIPLVGFSIILAVCLLQVKNTSFSSHFIRGGILLIEALFLGIFVIGNMYYIALEELDYDHYGKTYQNLVNEAQSILQQLPLDQTLVFVNFSTVNMLEVISSDLSMPKLMFVRPTAPWKLVYIEDLLTFCAYTNKGEGLFRLQDKKLASQHIRDGNYTILVFSDDAGFFIPSTIEPYQIEKILQELGEKNQRTRVMALRYIPPP